MHLCSSCNRRTKNSVMMMIKSNGDSMQQTRGLPVTSLISLQSADWCTFHTHIATCINELSRQSLVMLSQWSYTLEVPSLSTGWWWGLTAIVLRQGCSDAMADPGIWNGEADSPPSPSPFPLFFPLPLSSLPLELGPLNPVRGSGEGCM